MTEVFVIPVIRRQDYGAFRRDAGSTFASTYDEWMKLLAEEVAQARHSGKTVVEAEVDFDEFQQYCRKTGKMPNPMVLLEFAAHTPLGEA